MKNKENKGKNKESNQMNACQENMKTSVLEDLEDVNSIPLVTLKY